MVKRGDLIHVSTTELDGCRWHLNGAVGAVGYSRNWKDILVEAMVTDVHDLSYRSRKNRRNGGPTDAVVTFMSTACIRDRCGRPDHNLAYPRHTHTTREGQVTVIGDLASIDAVEAYLNADSDATETSSPPRASP